MKRPDCSTEVERTETVSEEDGGTPHHLDTLAELLELSSASCTSICLINKQLLITDNQILAGAKENSNHIDHIQNVIKYLSAASSLENKTYPNEIKGMIADICIRKFKAKRVGRNNAINSLNDEQLKKLADILAEAALNYDGEKRRCISIDDTMDNFDVAQSEAVAFFAELGNTLIRRLHRVKTALKVDVNMQELKNAIQARQRADCFVKYSIQDNLSYSDYIRVHHAEQPGWFIVATHDEGSIGGKSCFVHSELKMIDFLIASRILTMSGKQQDAPIYIGISKRCCKNCHQRIKLLNALLGASIMTAPGYHSVTVKEDSVKPIFLREEQVSWADNNKDFNHVAYYLDDDDEPIFIDSFQEICEHEKDVDIFLLRDANLIEKISELLTKKNDAIENKEPASKKHKKDAESMYHRSPVKAKPNDSKNFDGNVVECLNKSQQSVLEARYRLDGQTLLPEEGKSYRSKIGQISQDLDALGEGVKKATMKYEPCVYVSTRLFASDSSAPVDQEDLSGVESVQFR